MICYYGFCASRKHKLYHSARKLISEFKLAFKKSMNTWRNLLVTSFNIDPLLCPKCNSTMLFDYGFYKEMRLIMKEKNKKEIEFIPTEIVEMLDCTDQVNVDTSVPLRFDCEHCSSKIVPKYYIGVKGKIYKYED